MRKAALLLATCAAVAAALFYGLRAALDALRVRGGIWQEAWRTLYGAPPTPQRLLIGLSVALILLALALTPLAIAERRSERAYERKVGELRVQRPLDVVAPYAGPEGEGVAFQGPEGRALVLRGALGVGAPTVLRERAAADPEPREAASFSPE